MKNVKKVLAAALLYSCAFVVIARAADHNAPATPGTPTGSSSAAPATPMPASALFDRLGQEPDVVYLIANSSVVFGPDPHGRSEEVTFIGPVTVPKWPMQGYGRRVLPDGRQQIDIELTQSELTGESYLLKSPIMLAEHPDLRSLGTITERPKSELVPVSYKNENTTTSKDSKNSKKSKESKSSDSKDKKSDDAKKAESKDDAAEEAPADFVVERKVLMTTAKGILYNETAVPVRGRINSIPPIKFEGTPTGVNTFRGMEIPIALLDQDGAVNGWFYSKSHMAYAVLPAAVERSFIKGTVQLRSGDKVETVEISGPGEIHHHAQPGSSPETNMEVMMLALRGHSELLGDVMFTETFSDRDHFSRGKINWNENANSNFDLYVDLYTPSSKLTTHAPLAVAGQFSDCKVSGKLEKGKLSLPLLSGKGHFSSNGTRMLFDESEKPGVEIVKIDLNVAERI
ncbi:MAG TPA: DUF6004 family protein [Candidatus Angelobacter sp.]